MTGPGSGRREIDVAFAVRSAGARLAVGVVAVLLVGGAFWVDGSGTESSASTGPEITVVDAYVREPAVDDVAAAYFTVRNAGDEGDTLVSVSSDAAVAVGIHDLPGMADDGMSGGMDHMVAGPMTVPARQSVTLSPGQGHVMLEQPTVPLEPGETVTLVLTFAEAGELTVTAPVIAIGVDPPGGRP